MKKLTLLFAVGYLTLHGCATAKLPSYKLYPGPTRSPDQLAMLQFGDYVCTATIDGLKASCSDYAEVLLLPGRHRISFLARFPVSVIVNPDMWDGVNAFVDLHMQAGRVYVLHGDRTTGYGYEMWAWVEDANSGERFSAEVRP